MPIVELKSDLSKIKKLFGSETTTANAPGRFRPTELRFALSPFPISTTTGVNYFEDIHATGFTTVRQELDPTEYIRIGPYDVGEFSFERQRTIGIDVFSNTHATGFTPERKHKDPTEFKSYIPPMNLDFNGNVIPIYGPIEYTLFPSLHYIHGVVREATSTYTGVSTFATPSRLLIKHDKGRSSNIGFTNYIGWSTLQNYYDQLIKQDGKLGIRDNNVLGFDQPYVIKNIGDRWGFDGLETHKFIHPVVAKVINFAGGLLNDMGGAVLGREPNEYLGNAIGSLERMGKFLLSPKGIAFLVKQNVLMKRNVQKTRTDVKYGLITDLEKKAVNPRAYNVLSLGSLPGVAHFSIAKYDPDLIITPYFDTIASMINPYVIKLATTVATLTRDAITRMSIPGISGRIFPNMSKSKLPEGITNTIDSLRETARAIDAKRKAFDDFTSRVQKEVSKRSQIALHPDAKLLSEIGVDKVNLIPYGSDEYKGDSVDKLDFIPFKFKDKRTDKWIVFRAILSGITDTFTPEYAEERYVGRPDKVYVYQGTDRTISFTFDVYPKSDMELITLWEKLNYLAGLTYPHWSEPAAGGGMGMIAPFSTLTIGQMYKDTPGYIQSLSYTVQDNGTWETTFAKLPKYIQVNCTFVHIPKRLPSATQKHYEFPWVATRDHHTGFAYLNLLTDSAVGDVQLSNRVAGGTIWAKKTSAVGKFLDFAGLD